MAGRVTLYWSVRARRRLREIRNYISGDDPPAARKWVRRVRALVRLLADQPELGRVVPDYEQVDLRELIYAKRYRVIYRYLRDESEIEIITIFHTSQPLPDQL